MQVLLAAALFLPGDGKALAREYVGAVAKLNDAHARKPEAKDEAELARRLPASAAKALADLLSGPGGPGGLSGPAGREASEALVECGEAALDLDRMEDFERVQAALRKLDPAAERKLGIALSRPRVQLRGLDGVEPEGLSALGDALERILDAYAEVFGFTAWSKVPGKKLRVRVHLVEKIVKPPHFAPEFPWHSEIDFPVIDARAFGSPTADGKFLFYGLCHELGHVIAMWGNPGADEDHHAWAHYTGVAIVEHLSKAGGGDPALAGLKDVRWRSLEIERKRIADERIGPSTKDRDGVLALLIALHDAVGPKAIGGAIDALDREGRSPRVNRVRYYSMKDFRRALLETDAGKERRKEIAAIFP